MRCRLPHAPPFVPKVAGPRWRCAARWDGNPLARGYSSVTTAEKPYYVTTPIFYVNAGDRYAYEFSKKAQLLTDVLAPHVGHLYTIVLADVFKRYHALKGKKAILCTGTDEHGMKIQQAAKKAGQDVRAFCNANYKSFETLAGRAGVQYDHFIRTSDPDHRFAVQHFWLMLKERGYIYASKHEGWYSVSDETFYPASTVHLTLDPSTGRKFMASQETGKEVEWTSETNYHFRLSSLRDRLLQFYKDNPKFVEPATRMQDVVQQVDAGLSDLSVSRPVDRLSWGIPVPDDTSQTIYVWLDALINYLTKANYPFQIPGKEDAAGWPADLHIVGKDIVRFHCIYWPAFLLALDLPLPKQILTHAHWTLGHEKMSKSRGNVVNPFFALDRFGSDVMRYYLIRDGGIKDDSNYDNEYIIQRYKSLQGLLGNLVSRVTRPKEWNVRKAIEKGNIAIDEPAQSLLKNLQSLPGSVDEMMARANPGLALREVLNRLDETNKYIDTASPWRRLDKNGNINPVVHHPAHETIEQRLHSIIYLCSESIRICGILLQPIMPSRMKHVLDLMGVEEGKRHFKYLDVGSDREYGVPMCDVGKGKEGTVFPPLRSHF
ncbi:MAG: hypothetical protein Q9174_004858 [Haloplaca sp. 1 TL-2023]